MALDGNVFQLFWAKTLGVVVRQSSGRKVTVEEFQRDLVYHIRILGSSITFRLLFQQSLKTLGCTTPFGISLDNICTDKTKGELAIQLFKKLRSQKRFEDCLYPCTNLKVRLDKVEFGEVIGATRAKFMFDQYIRVTTSYVSYTGLELVAEVGGYVGLFLGLSVYHLSHAFNTFVQYILHKE